MDFQGKKITVLGMGKSGIALARELSQRGAEVLISDTRSADELAGPLSQLSALPVQPECGGHSDKVFESSIMLVSPGVPVHSAMVQKALERGMQVMGEVEVAWRLSPVPFVAVTGTNGKSTTVTLIDRMLGERSVLAGNIGNPLVAEVSSAPEGGYVVAEISSFQLETVYDFRPKVAVLTNVTPDHLDRHPDLAEYFAAKARIFANQGEGDLAVFCVDDEQADRMCRLLAEGSLPAWLDSYPQPEPQGRPTIMRCSAKAPVEQGTWYEDGAIWYRAPGRQPERVVEWGGFAGLPGPHNLQNALAAVCCAKYLGVSHEDIAKALQVHAPLHYRMELVHTLNGVRFIDDSKGTNPGSVISALRAYDSPIILIAGGKDKGMDFSELGKEIVERARLVVLIGEAADRLQENILRAGQVEIMRCASLQEAVRRSYERAHPGDVVLLSPACSSFDMFRNAEERGELFARWARELG